MKHSETVLSTRRRISRQGFIWNAIYAGISALQSSILLFAISRTKELGEAGIITIGFTVANLMMIIGQYGIRNYQVTDVKEEYSFSDYFHLRMITSCGALLFSTAYLVIMFTTGKYSGHKTLAVLEITLLKLVDTVEGLYVGRLQQKGRLDIGSMIASVRIGISTLVIFLLLWICDNIHICFVFGLLVSVLLDVFLLPRGQPFADYKVRKIQTGKIRRILISAFPICLGMAMHNYIGNGPKYLVDLFMNDEIQAISGYVMMPMFIITVLNSFLMQPTVKTLGDVWNRKDFGQLRKLIIRHMLIVSGLSFGVLIAGIFIGLPLLSVIYKVQLQTYWHEFILLMIGGTFYTLSAYMIVLLTTVRRQAAIAAGCLSAVIVYVAFGRIVVEDAGLLGASRIYIIANLTMMSVFAVSFVMKIRDAGQQR